MIVSIFWEMNCSFQLLFMNVLTFGGRKRGGGGGGGGGRGREIWWKTWRLPVKPGELAGT